MVIFTVDLYLSLVKFASLFYFGPKRSRGQDHDLHVSFHMLLALTHDIQEPHTLICFSMKVLGFTFRLSGFSVECRNTLPAISIPVSKIPLISVPVAVVSYSSSYNGRRKC